MEVSADWGETRTIFRRAKSRWCGRLQRNRAERLRTSAYVVSRMDTPVRDTGRAGRTAADDQNQRTTNNGFAASSRTNRSRSDSSTHTVSTPVGPGATSTASSSG